MKIKSEKLKEWIENNTGYSFYAGNPIVNRDALLEKIRELEKEKRK